MAGPGHGAPGVLGPGLPRRHLLRDLSGQERGRGGDAEVLQAVLLPRPHRQPRHAGDARLDPRRRRARLQPVARLRRGVRQPRSDRRLRGRRRRSRDRAARDRLALQQVPQPDPRRRGAADPATSTATRSPTRRSSRASATRSWRRCSSATATRRISSKAATPTTMHQKMAATLDAGDRRDPRASRSRRATSDNADAAALADDRAALAEGLDRPEGDRRPQGRRLRGARTRCRSPTCATIRRNLKLLEDWLRSYKPEELFDASGTAASRSCKALAPDGHAAHERQSARQRRAAAQGARSCRTSASTPWRCDKPGTGAAREHQAARRVPARRHDATT